MKNWAKRSRPPYSGDWPFGIEEGRLSLLVLAEEEGLLEVEEADSSKK